MIAPGWLLSQSWLRQGAPSLSLSYMLGRDIEKSKLHFFYISNLAARTSYNIQSSLPLGADKSDVRVRDPLIRIHRVVAVRVLWPQLYLPLPDN